MLSHEVVGVDLVEVAEVLASAAKSEEMAPSDSKTRSLNQAPTARPSS